MVERRVKIFLKNGFKYEGDFISEDSNFFKLFDYTVKGVVELNQTEISTKEWMQVK